MTEKQPKKEEKKTEVASDTVKTQLATYSIENAQQKQIIENLTAENEQLKQQNIELAATIENDLKSDLILKIIAVSEYTKEDLATLTIEELQNKYSTLTKTAGFTATYKNIRAGTASTGANSRLTVGNLYGLTRAEILKRAGGN